MTIQELARKEYPIWGANQRSAYIKGATAVLDELEMTLSVSEKGYLKSNIEKLIKELKGV